YSILKLKSISRTACFKYPCPTHFRKLTLNSVLHLTIMDRNSLILNVSGPWKEGRIYEYFIQPEHSEKLLLSVRSTFHTVLILLLYRYCSFRNHCQHHGILRAFHLMAFCIPPVQDDWCRIRVSGCHFEPHCRGVTDDDRYQYDKQPAAFILLQYTSMDWYCCQSRRS